MLKTAMHKAVDNNREKSAVVFTYHVLQHIDILRPIYSVKRHVVI